MDRILHEEVLITSDPTEINKKLKDGTYRVVSVTPIQFSTPVSFEGTEARGVMTTSLCFVLAKIETLLPK